MPNHLPNDVVPFIVWRFSVVPDPPRSAIGPQKREEDKWLRQLNPRKRYATATATATATSLDRLVTTDEYPLLTVFLFVRRPSPVASSGGDLCVCVCERGSTQAVTPWEKVEALPRHSYGTTSSLTGPEDGPDSCSSSHGVIRNTNNEGSVTRQRNLWYDHDPTSEVWSLSL